MAHPFVLLGKQENTIKFMAFGSRVGEEKAAATFCSHFSGIKSLVISKV